MVLLAIESLIIDRADGEAALTALARLSLPGDSLRLRVQAGLLTADALLATGLRDSARTVLGALSGEFPNNRRIQDRLARLESGG